MTPAAHSVVLLLLVAARATAQPFLPPTQPPPQPPPQPAPQPSPQPPPSPPPTTDTYSYVAVPAGSCATDKHVVQSDEECSTAAATLGYSFNGHVLAEVRT